MESSQPQPSRIPHPGRILVLGDVHGDLNRLISCLVCTNIIRVDTGDVVTWIAQPPNTVVVQLGDQIDGACRGGDPAWEEKEGVDIDVIVFMDMLDSIAQMGGGRVISLLGNHEIMNVLQEYQCVSQHSMNVTGALGRQMLFTPGSGRIALLLSKRNVVVQVGPYIFCHGGLLPMHLELLKGNFDTANWLIQMYLRGEGHLISTSDREVLNHTVFSQEGILWNRLYLTLQHTDDVVDVLLNTVFDKTKAICMFVGHNTVENIYSIAKNKLFFADAGLSRCYPTKVIQCIEIVSTPASNTDTSKQDDVVRVLRLSKSDKN